MEFEKVQSKLLDVKRIQDQDLPPSYNEFECDRYDSDRHTLCDVKNKNNSRVSFNETFTENKFIKRDTGAPTVTEQAYVDLIGRGNGWNVDDDIDSGAECGSNGAGGEDSLGSSGGAGDSGNDGNYF